MTESNDSQDPQLNHQEHSAVTGVRETQHIQGRI